MKITVCFVFFKIIKEAHAHLQDSDFNMIGKYKLHNILVPSHKCCKNLACILQYLSMHIYAHTNTHVY